MSISVRPARLRRRRPWRRTPAPAPRSESDADPGAKQHEPCLSDRCPPPTLDIAGRQGGDHCRFGCHRLRRNETLAYAIGDEENASSLVDMEHDRSPDSAQDMPPASRTGDRPAAFGDPAAVHRPTVASEVPAVGRSFRLPRAQSPIGIGSKAVIGSSDTGSTRWITTRSTSRVVVGAGLVVVDGPMVGVGAKASGGAVGCGGEADSVHAARP